MCGMLLNESIQNQLLVEWDLMLEKYACISHGMEAAGKSAKN